MASNKHGAEVTVPLEKLFVPSPEQKEWVDLLKKGFVGNILACASIAMAISGSPTNDAGDGNLLDTDDYTLMPDDFIPQVNTLKPDPDHHDPTPVEDRFQHVISLDKREQGVRGNRATFPSISMADFQARLTLIRQGVVKWAAAETEAYFVQEINKEHKELKIESSSDFCDIIRKGPWNNHLKGIVYSASEGVWGSSNQWAINLEQKFCKILKIKFTGMRSNNKKLKRHHKGKCIAAILVKGKGSLVGKIRNTCKRRYLEAVYCRSEKTKLGGTTSEVKEGKTTVPRMLFQELAMESTHGFCGKLALCEGHPDLPSKLKKDNKENNDKDKAKNDSPSMASAASVGTLSSLDDTPQGGFAVALQAYGVNSVDEFKKFMDSLSPDVKKSLIQSPDAKKRKSHPEKSRDEASQSTEASSVPENLVLPRTPSTPTKPKDPPGCDHEDITNFVPYTNDLGYFKTPYLEQHPLWPRQCGGCNILFVDKKKADVNIKTELRVCPATQVYLCKNGANSAHPCTLGYCRNCRVEKVGSTPTTRNRKKSSRLSHNE